MIEKQDWQWLIAIVINVIVQIWAVQATNKRATGRRAKALYYLYYITGG